MTSVPEISVVRAPAPAETATDEISIGVAAHAWAPVELPPASRPSPTWLVVLALLAGIGAMILGALAVLAATRSGDDRIAVAAPAVTAKAPVAVDAERRALTLLAKPSTDRFVLSGAGGRLVLVVGSGGRAAILVRGLPRAASGRPYYAWVTGAGRTVRAARLTGAERAVFLSVPVARGESVAVATERATALRAGPGRIVATRR
jgi:hypothetical protein